MITNLFSVFDPASTILVSINWSRALIFALILTPSFWARPTKFSVLLTRATIKLYREFKTLLGSRSPSGRTILLITLFTFLLVNNFIGLFPYIFTSSRHIALTLTLSLPLWLAFMLFGWLTTTNNIFAHIVPQRTPRALIPFIVLIESISNVIRPLTLAVRLIANMVAGHLLITLLGNQTAAASNILLAALIITQILLLTLESAVAVIQSYVFAVLSTLYAGEITSH